MKSIWFSFIFFGFFVHAAQGQTDSARSTRNHFFLEVGGAGSYGSLNYERTLVSKNYLSFAIRGGFSTYRITDYENNINPDLIIPVGVNVAYGDNHKAEFGVCETYTGIVKASLDDYEKKRESNLSTVFSFGYRYQKSTRGVVFRCAYTPILEFNSNFRHWGAISIGYSF